MNGITEENERSFYKVGKILKIVHKGKANKMFTEGDYVYFNDLYKTLEDAKAAITQDKTKDGDLYYYFVTESDDGKNPRVVYEE